MRHLGFARFAIMVGIGGAAWAQPVLTLSSGSALPGGTVALNLSLSSPAGSEPSALQWTYSYPAAVASINVANGPALTSAGKSITCTAGSLTYTCVASGFNSNIISNGVVGLATVTLNSNGATSTVGINNALAATATGGTETVSGGSGTITVSLPPPTLSSLSCNATSLSPAASSSCAITLSRAAPAGGALVSLSSSVNTLGVPGSVTVAAGSSTANFTALAGAFTTDQSSTITATLNGSSASASISLFVPPLVSAVQCAAIILTPGANTSCTVTLNKAAPTGGAVVTLGTSGAAISVPSSVTVAAAATSAPFNVTAGAVTATQTASISASLNGSSTKMAITLVTISISSLQCGPSTLYPNSTTNCTVTLGTAAPTGGAPISLSSSMSLVSVPLSITVPASQASASFSAQAGNYVAGGTVTISATAGASQASALLVLSPPLLTRFTLNGTASEVSGTNNGSTVTPAESAGLTGKVVVNGSGSVNFSPGGGVYFLNCCANSNNAYYKFTGSAIGNVFNLSQGQISFKLQSRYSFAQRQISAASARNAFDVREGNGNHQFYFMTQIVSGSLVFYYEIAGTPFYYYVPAGTEDRLFGSGVTLSVMLQWNGSTASLYLNGSAVRSASYVPAAANWNASSNFDLGAYEYLNFGGFESSDDIVGQFSVASSLGLSTGSTSSASLMSATVAQPGASQAGSTPRVKSLSCGQASVTAGSKVLCQLNLESAALETSSLSLTSDSAQVRLPASIALRPGQTQARFELIAASEAPSGPVAITAQSDDFNVLEGDIQITPGIEPSLQVPRVQTVTAGTAAQFTVLTDGQNELGVADLPAGANFDASTGMFSWAPASAELGVHRIRFTATNSLGLSTTKVVELTVVREQSAPGPEILTVGESDQALVVHAGSRILASVPNALYDGRPARTGDRLSLSVSGIDCNQSPASRDFQLRVATAYSKVDAIQAVEDAPGVCRIDFTVPAGVGAKATVMLEVGARNGKVLTSNTASIALED